MSRLRAFGQSVHSLGRYYLAGPEGDRYIQSNNPMAPKTSKARATATPTNKGTKSRDLDSFAAWRNAGVLIWLGKDDVWISLGNDGMLPLSTAPVP